MKRLRVGFVPLVDAANVIVAARCGFAEAEGLELELSRERSWASVRDKLSVGYLDAAHVLSPMLVASHLQLPNFSSPLMAPTMLSLDGNEVTLSSRLTDLCSGILGYTPKEPADWGRGIAHVIKEGHQRGGTPLTFACVFPYSSHAFLLRDWLATAGVDPNRDVNITVLPPVMMADALGEGSVDGFCAGPPWGRLAEEHGAGRVAFRAVQMQKMVPEKALAMRMTDPLRDAETVPNLVRAIIRASRWIADEDNADSLFAMLSERDCVGVAPQTIRSAVDRSGMQLFGDNVLRPDPAHAKWISDEMERWLQVDTTPLEQRNAMFRNDLFDEALNTLA
ncbi:MAG: CmpA/NrtA family ABC transporter substrate-binding protein [Pseudomonadota bacterium]